MPLTSRPLAGEADLPALNALRAAIAAYVPNTPAVGEAVVRSVYLDPMPGNDLMFRLWELDGALVGVGEVVVPDEAGDDGPIVYVRPRVHPTMAGSSVVMEIVAWAEGEALRRFGDGVRIEATVRGDASETIALLERDGYRQDRVFVRMERPLDGPVVDQPLPAGYVVRPLAPEAEIDAWMALFNAAFADHYDFRPWNREARLQEMGYAWHAPDLDLVAVAPDGRLAGFCWTTRRDVAEEPPAWHLSVVGTAREHRRRGLAGAMVAVTVERLLAGGGVIDLTVDATSPTGANQLYERLGFRPVARLRLPQTALGEGLRRSTTPW